MNFLYYSLEWDWKFKMEGDDRNVTNINVHDYYFTRVLFKCYIPSLYEFYNLDKNMGQLDWSRGRCFLSPSLLSFHVFPPLTYSFNLKGLKI